MPQSKIDVIADGLTVQGGGTASEAAVVLSEDFQSAYSIAVEIDDQARMGLARWACGHPITSRAGKE